MKSEATRVICRSVDILYDFYFHQHTLRWRVFCMIFVGGTLYGSLNTIVFGRSEARVSLECFVLIGCALLIVPLLICIFTKI